MKTLKNSLLIALSALAMWSCASDCGCDNIINTKNISGEWEVTSVKQNEEVLELGNQSFTFNKDNSFKQNLSEGTWEFTEYRNEIHVITQTEAYDINIVDFSKNTMNFTIKKADNKLTEYELVKK